MSIATIIVVSFVVGLPAAMLVNWLADQLPHLGEASDEQTGENPESSERKMVPRRVTAPRCVICAHPLPPLAYSGIAAWLTGRRRCLKCGHTLSVRHLLIEIVLVIGLAYLLVSRSSSPAIVLFIYLTIFVLIGVIDMEHRYVLSVVMLPAFIFALLEVIFSHRVTDIRAALAGYAVGQMAVMGVYVAGAAYLWLVNRRRLEKVTEVAFGFGDVTLATFCGLILGTPSVVYMLVLMIFVGGAIALLYLIYRSLLRRDYHAHTPVAYGPAILLSTLATLLWGHQVAVLIWGEQVASFLFGAR